MFSINDHVLVTLLSDDEMAQVKGPKSSLLVHDPDSEILVGRVIHGGNQKDAQIKLETGDLVFFTSKATFGIKVEGKTINVVKQSSILLGLNGALR